MKIIFVLAIAVGLVIYKLFYYIEKEREGVSIL